MFFFFNDTATPEIYPLSLHDALPTFTNDGGYALWRESGNPYPVFVEDVHVRPNPAKPSRNWWLWPKPSTGDLDRKSTRLNSSHANISYAVFCLKKKKLLKN